MPHHSVHCKTLLCHNSFINRELIKYHFRQIFPSNMCWTEKRILALEALCFHNYVPSCRIILMSQRDLNFYFVGSVYGVSMTTSGTEQLVENQLQILEASSEKGPLLAIQYTDTGPKLSCAYQYRSPCRYIITDCCPAVTQLCHRLSLLQWTRATKGAPLSSGTLLKHQCMDYTAPGCKGVQ